MDFYTSVVRYKNNILVRVRNSKTGVASQYKEKYRPYLFIPSPNSDGVYRTLDGRPVSKIDFDGMYDASEFLKKYEEVSNFEIFGMKDYAYPYIYDNFRNCEYSASVIDVCFIDIETEITGGFPDIDIANNAITAITMKRGGHYHVFGC
jgi:hypothetical protein